MKNKFGILLLACMFLSFTTLSAQEYVNLSVSEKDIPIRELRRIALTGNIGWNSLTGVGISANTYATKNVAFDFGLGVSATGIKLGGRFNYVILSHDFSPVAAAGFLYGFGFRDTEIEFDGEFSKVGYTIDESPYLQLAFGMERISRNGFMFKIMTGYAILITDSNYNIKYGNPTATELDALNLALGSGISIDFSIGYAFGNNIKKSK